MEALEELPELETQIQEGSLSLANVSQVQHFCVQNQKSFEEKKEIFMQVSGLSKRETERKFAAIAPMPERPEKVRPINADSTELRITLSAETLSELEKIRDLIAHAHPGASYAEVIAYLAKLGIKKLDPAARESKPLPPGEETDDVPVATRRFVWKRDGGRCGYRCAETGRVCGATRRLQIDHIVPRAQGGGHEPENLRLRCRRHNLLAAIEVFGTKKMEPYLRNKAQIKT